MPFPNITSSLVCQDLRREEGNLVSLIGVFGGLPQTQIFVSDLTAPVLSIIFVFMGEAQSQKDKMNLRFELLAPNGMNVVTLTITNYIINANRASNIYFRLNNIIFPLEGIYNIRIFADEDPNPVFESTVFIGQKQN